MSLKPHLRLLAALLFLSIPAFVACSPADEQVENPTPEASGNVEDIASATAVATTVPTAQPTATPAPTATATPTPLQQAYADARQIVVDKALEPTESLVQLAAALFVIPNPNDSGTPYASPENATLHEENNLTYARLSDGTIVQLVERGGPPQTPDDLADDLLYMIPATDENGQPTETILRGSVNLAGETIDAWVAYNPETNEISRFVTPDNQWATPLVTDANGLIQVFETRAIDDNGNATGETAYITFNPTGEAINVSSPNEAFDSLADYLADFTTKELVTVTTAEGRTLLGIKEINQDRTTHVLVDGTWQEATVEMQIINPGPDIEALYQETNPIDIFSFERWSMRYSETIQDNFAEPIITVVADAEIANRPIEEFFATNMQRNNSDVPLIMSYNPDTGQLEQTALTQNTNIKVEVFTENDLIDFPSISFGPGGTVIEFLPQYDAANDELTLFLQVPDSIMDIRNGPSASGKFFEALVTLMQPIEEQPQTLNTSIRPNGHEASFLIDQLLVPEKSWSAFWNISKDYYEYLLTLPNLNHDLIREYIESYCSTCFD